jgi:uncharacterized membrane protein YdbT with pleckstrin-like domain
MEDSSKYPRQPEQVNDSHVTSAPSDAPGEGFDPQLRVQYSNEPKVVHATREVSPEALPVSEQNQLRSERSKKRYPRLNLTEGEFVVLDIKRHPIGLLLPVSVTALLLVALTSLLIFYPGDIQSTSSLPMPTFVQVLWPALLLMLLVSMGGLIAIWVYLQNQFYMTNESVIQEIQTSLFSRHEQTVSLGSIEDASFKQHGILQTMLNYGTIRLSTEGEETTYRFSYVANPRNQVAVLNNAIEAFKNGRPVDPYEN